MYEEKGVTMVANSTIDAMPEDPGLIETMLSFLRADVNETRAAAERLRERANFLFGEPPTLNQAIGEGPTIGCAKDELLDLMRQQGSARSDLWDQIHRLDQDL